MWAGRSWRCSSTGRTAAGPVRRPPALCRHGGLPPAGWADTIGYALARGRCPAGCKLPARVWYLPALGAATGAVIAVRAVDARHAALAGLFAPMPLAFIGTDTERRLLSNRLMHPALGLALALSWASPRRSALNSLLGGVVALAAMSAVFVAFPGFGFGDVKLAALRGLLTGLAHVASALLVGVLAGRLGALTLLLFRRARPGSAITYGPYLALGAFVGMLTP